VAAVELVLLVVLDWPYAISIKFKDSLLPILLLLIIITIIIIMLAITIGDNKILLVFTIDIYWQYILLVLQNKKILAYKV
jgi:hypothetical protein